MATENTTVDILNNYNLNFFFDKKLHFQIFGQILLDVIAGELIFYRPDLKFKVSGSGTRVRY